MSEKLTIALTGRRPIWDKEYECQANRTWLLRVPQHADGRAIYGVYATNFQNGQTAVAGSCWTPERIPRRQSTG
jgi:hypothetical protein